jgi:hypothetical protein
VIFQLFNKVGVYRHPFYMDNIPTAGELSLLLNCFHKIQNKRLPLLSKAVLNISFIQTGLSVAVLGLSVWFAQWGRNNQIRLCMQCALLVLFSAYYSDN